VNARGCTFRLAAGLDLYSSHQDWMPFDSQVDADATATKQESSDSCPRRMNYVVFMMMALGV